SLRAIFGTLYNGHTTVLVDHCKGHSQTRIHVRQWSGETLPGHRRSGLTNLGLLFLGLAKEPVLKAALTRASIRNRVRFLVREGFRHKRGQIKTPVNVVPVRG